MDPVNIDFILGGNVEQQGPKTEKALTDIADAGIKAAEQVKQRIRETKENIQVIESDLKKLRKAFDGAAPGRAKENAGLELRAAAKALDEEKKILTELDSKVQATTQKHTMLRTEIMNVKDELARLEMQGKRGGKEWDELSAKLARLNNQFQDTNMQARILADDQRGFRAMAQGASGLAGALSAAVGAASLFGAENEELTRIQTRLQAVMAITIGLQAVSETLNKDSYFSVVLLTKAKTMLTVATARLSVALGVSTAAARVFMATITLGLSIAITALIVLIDKHVQKQKEQREVEKEIRKEREEAAKKTADEYGKEMAKVEALRAQLSNENATRDQKLAIIKRLQGIMPGYTAALDAEGKVIRENKKAIDAYMISLDKSLRLKAAEKELEKIYSKMFSIQLLRKASEPSDNPFERAAQNRANAGSLAKADPAAKAELAKAVDGQLAELQKQARRIKDMIVSEGLFDLNTFFGTGEAGTTADGKTFDAQSALQQQLLAINKQTSDLLFAQAEDNLQKRLDQISREEEAAVDAIRSQQDKIVDAYNEAGKGKKGFKKAAAVADIDPAMAAALEEQLTQLQSTYQVQRKAMTEEYYAELEQMAREMADERVKITNDYAARIIEAEQAGMYGLATMLEAERDRLISDLTRSMIEESSVYNAATNDRLVLTKTMNDKLLAMLRERIAASKDLTDEDRDILLAGLDKAEAARASGAIDGLIKNLKRLKKAREDADKAEQVGDVDGALKAAAAISESTDAIGSYGNELLNYFEHLSSGVIEILDKLGGLTEEENKLAEATVGLVAGAGDLAVGIATGNVGQIISGAIGMITNAITLFDKKSRDIDRAQKQSVENIDNMTRAYERLQRAIDGALGTEAYRLQREQAELLRKEVEEYDRLIEEESKRTGKKLVNKNGVLSFVTVSTADQDKIAEWEKAKADAVARSEDLVQAVSDAIAGTTARDLAADLANSLVEAFEAGESAAEAMGKTIDQVIRNAVIQSLKLKYLEAPIKAIVDQFAADMESGGGLTSEEADRFRLAITILGKDFDAALRQANEALDGIFNTSTNAKGIKGDVMNMTEQTGSAVVGQIAAMRLMVATILANSKNSVEDMARVIMILERIRDNTEYCRRLERIDADINYLRINGIKVQ